MKLHEIKNCIEGSKKEIEELLRKDVADRVPKIMDIINRSEVNYCTNRDNQLMTLRMMCKIWESEKNIGDGTTFMDDVHNLKDLEKKYNKLKYYCRRFENDMPQEFWLEGIEYILDNNITGIALYSVIEIQTWKKEENILKIAKYLKVNEAMIQAVIMLQMAVAKYEKNSELIMELADCWLLMKNWKQAKNILEKLEHPSKEVQEIIRNLEEVLKDEDS